MTELEELKTLLKNIDDEIKIRTNVNDLRSLHRMHDKTADLINLLEKGEK